MSEAQVITPENANIGIDFGQLFKEIKTVAVVGYSNNPERAGYYVPQYLSTQGYKIIAINPKFGEEVDGLRCYPNLASLLGEIQVDVVNVFRAPAFVAKVLADVWHMASLPTYVLMHPGAENEEAYQAAAAQGITPIMYSCMMAAHKIWR